MKICAKCKIKKDYSLFSKAKNRKDGYYNYCKDCKRKQDRLNYCPEKRKEYRLKNIEKSKENWRNWRDKNKNELNNKKLKYYHENKKVLNKKQCERIKKRIQEDDLFRFKIRLRSLIRSSFKRCINNEYKKSKNTEDILGCDLNFFIEYISNKFVDGMCFENYGKWHLDHIIPLSTAKTEKDVIKLNSYLNIQPLWAIDNIKKSNKIL